MSTLPGIRGFVCRFLLATGLRWAEACRAKASDVKDGVLTVAQTKSGRVRRVPVPEGMGEELRTRVGRLVPYVENSPGSFNRTIQRLTGIDEFHVHRCRHTFASAYLEAGGSLPVLQQLLGHASISTTQRHARLSDDAVRAEVGRVSNSGGKSEP